VEKCTACGSTNVTAARLMGAAVQPENVKALARAFAGSEVKASVCVDCGQIGGLRVADLERFLKQTKD
jgi:hypothetical protein